MSKNKIIFLLIIVLAIFLRFYNLSNIPPSASLDEASIGYNAYSILNTGLDEYGTRFPILLRAYDDWRPALYVYLTIPFIKIFGLSVFTVRLPSVILSVLTVVATYFVTRELIRISKARINASVIGLLSSFLLAISPWHIYISRLGHEVNAGLAFFIFAFLFFLRRKIYLSFIFFALSFASYQSEKIFIPLFIFGLLIIFSKEVLKNKKKIIIASLLSLIILLPFLKETLSPNALIRFKATNVFDANQQQFYQQSIKFKNAVDKNDLVGKIIYNRRIVGFQIFVENYLSHFNPKWLFTNFTADPHKIPNIGLLYVWELPLLVVGFMFLRKFDRKVQLLIIFWIFIAPLPAAITTGAPHAMRVYAFLPSWQILCAVGAISGFNFYQNKTLRYLISGSFLIIILVSIVYLYNQYFIIFPKTQSQSFQYALANATPYVLKNGKNYKKVVFSNKENLYQSYMFFLFYSKYDPALYQKQGGTKSGGFAETHQFGKYEFRPIDWNKEEKNKENLYVGNINDFPLDKESLIVFRNLNEKETIKVISQ